MNHQPRFGSYQCPAKGRHIGVGTILVSRLVWTRSERFTMAPFFRTGERHVASQVQNGKERTPRGAGGQILRRQSRRRRVPTFPATTMRLVRIRR